MLRPTTLLFPHKLHNKELEEDPNHDLTYASVLESNVAADWKKWERGKGEKEENEEEGGRGGEKRGRRERERGERGEGEGVEEGGLPVFKAGDMVQLGMYSFSSLVCH